VVRYCPVDFIPLSNCVYRDEAIKNLRVLIVDDIAFNNDALTLILKAYGLEVERQIHVGMNGQQAFDLVKAQE
jgi:CheY-like chemotaxis protein